LSTLHFLSFKLHPSTFHNSRIWHNPIEISYRSISPHITTYIKRLWTRERREIGRSGKELMKKKTRRSSGMKQGRARCRKESTEKEVESNECMGV